METLKITDSVVVLNDKYFNNVRKGQVGIVVEVLTSKNNINVYEVEFSDREGKVLVSCAIEEPDLLKLYFD